MIKSTAVSSKLKCCNTATKKRFGQNFLNSEKVLETLINASKITKEDTIIEVGAGTGTITKDIAEQAKEVFAVEIDKDLIPKLRETTATYKNVKIVNLDILKFMERYPPEGGWKTADYKVIGAIPYSITSPLLHKLLMSKIPPRSVTLLIQLEVAQKICSKPPKATYLSNFIALYGSAKLVEKVGPNAFKPQPSVNSAIIHMEKSQKAPADLEKWSNFLHRGFSHPRKMLKHTFDKFILEKSKVNPSARAQEVKLEEWKEMYGLMA